jgi:hypothetical protein
LNNFMIGDKVQFKSPELKKRWRAGVDIGLVSWVGQSYRNLDEKMLTVQFDDVFVHDSDCSFVILRENNEKES